MGPPPRQECPFSSKCYRRNPHHFREFSHPHLAALLKAHSSLQLPSNVATSSISVEALQEQLRIYRDIEQGLMKAQEKPLENKTDKNSLKSPNQSMSENKNSKITTPENKSTSLNSFNDGADADLEEALRRSLADQSRSSQLRTSNGREEKDLFKPGGSQSSPGKGRVEKTSPSKKRPHSPEPPSSAKRPTSKLTLIQRRLDASEPYRFLLSKVQDCPESHRDS